MSSLYVHVCTCAWKMIVQVSALITDSENNSDKS